MNLVGKSLEYIRKISNKLNDELVSDLRKWAVDTGITAQHVNSLLRILKRYHSNLPTTRSTLVETRKLQKFERQNFGDNGKYVYFGIHCNLQKIINSTTYPDSTIFLQFNVDGIPIFHSSKIEFWPILCRIVFNPDIYRPFIVKLYCGAGKPKDLNLFLSDFITELNDILKNGINIGARIFAVKIKGFINDLPARILIKGTKSYSGYYSCERCMQRGFRVKDRLIFPMLHCQKRTDSSFRNMEQKEYHNQKTPFFELENVDLVHDFVIDSMHLCFLGVMKRLLTTLWMPPSPTKLSKTNILRLSQRLMNLSKQVPMEF